MYYNLTSLSKGANSIFNTPFSANVQGLLWEVRYTTPAASEIELVVDLIDLNLARFFSLEWHEVLDQHRRHWIRLLGFPHLPLCFLYDSNLPERLRSLGFTFHEALRQLTILQYAVVQHLAADLLVFFLLLLLRELCLSPPILQLLRCLLF